MFFGVFSFCTLKVSANISSACPPSSRVSPICHLAKPYGQGHTRRAHIKRRRLIMPLVALVQKKQSAPATAYKFWCLALATVVATAPPNSVFEQVSACIRTHRTSKVRIASHHNARKCKSWRSQYMTLVSIHAKGNSLRSNRLFVSNGRIMQARCLQ